MSEFLLINDKKYSYACNYRDDSILRNSFNTLTEKPMVLILSNGMKMDIGETNIYHILC